MKFWIFPASLKHADVSPVYKNVAPTDKSDFCSVSFLSLLSKGLERVISDQLSEYINELRHGFRNAHSTQHVSPVTKMRTGTWSFWSDGNYLDGLIWGLWLSFPRFDPCKI